MASKEQELMVQLETRVRQIILQDKNLQEQIRVLKTQIAQLNEQIGELTHKNEDLEAKYANLKVARILELSDSDTRNARQRLNHLVRDVDKCIALLKS